MQRAETVVEERPQPAMQVVPTEPSLRQRYYLLPTYIALLLLFCINIFIIFGSIVLLNHSLITLATFYYVIVPLISLFPFKPWRILNQRRQQAARYNLTTGILARAGEQPRFEASDLPDSFAIYAQRRWVPTCTIALFLGLVLILGGILTYTYGQSMLQEIQHGVSMAAVIWEISLNSALFLLFCGLTFYLLVISPRQQIIATRDGLACRRGNQTSFIPWHQARLFAIIGQASVNKQEPMLFYELASNDAVIRWPSANKFVNRGLESKVPANVTFLSNIQTRPAGSAAEFPQQVQFLNIIIAERTGLPLYDLR